MISLFLISLLTPEAPFVSPFPSASPSSSTSSGVHPKYQDCVRLVAKDLEIGRISARQWTEEGGGALAQHCLAVADIAAGFPKLGAARLADISKRSDAGDRNARGRVLAQAALAWLDGEETKLAQDAIVEALQYAPELGELHVVAAAVFAAAENWEAASEAADIAEAESLATAETFIVRARANRVLGKDYEAAEDVVSALTLDPFNLDALVLRGELKRVGIDIETFYSDDN